MNFNHYLNDFHLLIALKSDNTSTSSPLLRGDKGGEIVYIDGN